ncbi:MULTISPECIES: cupin-like domain-containing protein [Acetobacter]|uniref:Cupin-like domain-containing protein n=1 Tax=Acetobacter thailandicus TaxID=1502842 RepID=A0ABT3QCT0_9PROT|nr:MULTISPECIES: cupin-like domain-containing protein [Acetobacter]MBS0960413.1 cupin-like domain-containing protein [Acetobacter thailandicus]MBS1004352.1 cupin-like domain-containing protein [Acetobacter thailandicus]MCX2563075.1 cupin-like domain-containing protein [Acetobacter thailandicus]NHN95793.1 hypothetical protein [Acetobacter thailandicus]OUJ11901.1 hypothetical protein HK25_07410 [Acetobacter sp. DsW_059]
MNLTSAEKHSSRPEQRVQTQVLSRSVQVWIAESLAKGYTAGQIRTILINGNTPGELADREIAQAENSPYTYAARRCMVVARKRESLLKTLDFYHRMNSDYFRLKKETLPAYKTFIQNFLSINRAGLFSGSFDHWAARHWTPQSLLELVGAGTKIQVQAGRTGESAYEEKGEKLKRFIPFEELISAMLHGRGNDLYLTANNFFLDQSPFAALREQIGNIGDSYLNSEYLAKSVFLWMGPEGIVTGMHQDLNHILFCQIYGRKRFRLYPATQVPYMCNDRWIFSPVDPTQNIPEQHAEFRNAAAIDITVEPGDMLYIPAGWWHHVTGETASISISLTNLRGMPNHFIDYPPDYSSII